MMFEVNVEQVRVVNVKGKTKRLVSAWVSVTTGKRPTFVWPKVRISNFAEGA